MTEKELAVKRAECDVRLAETRVADAIEKLRQTKAKLQAEMTMEVTKLENEIARERLILDREKNYLKVTQTNLERGFDVNG